jgi:hypothetical protein
MEPRKVLRKRNGRLVPVYLWAVDYSKRKSMERKDIVLDAPQAPPSPDEWVDDTQVAEAANNEFTRLIERLKKEAEGLSTPTKPDTL